LESDALWVGSNDDTWALADLALIGIDDADESMGELTWADFDHDADLDIHVVDRITTDWMYVNQGDGTFVTVTADSLGLPDIDDTWRPTACDWGDFDRDGSLDCLYPNAGIYYNNGTGTFTAAAQTLIDFTLVAAWADVDDDLVPDFVTASDVDSVFYHGRSCGYGAIRVRAMTDADGDATDATTASDRDAIGALIEVDLDGDGDFLTTAPDRFVMYLVGSAMSGTHAQNQLAPVIGIGNALSVDVRVVFPDGSVVTQPNVALGSRIVIRDAP
jgi:hypothetical protein